MVINYNEDFSFKICLPNFQNEKNRMTGVSNRLLQPFNPLMTIGVTLLYLILEVVLAYANHSDKVCYKGHLFGMLSGAMIGIVILDNVREHRWEKILKYILLFIFSISFLIMVILHFTFITEHKSEVEPHDHHNLPDPCYNCWKAFWNSSALPNNPTVC